MLVLILGPSGVGKSTLIQILVANHGWSPLVSIITRPERADEAYKISVSERSYSMLVATGKLWSNVVQHGASYGLLRSEVEAALADDTGIHVVDFGLSSRQQYFDGVPHLAVYVAAEDEDALRDRIIASGRSERVASSIAGAAEMDRWFATDGAALGAIRVVNYAGAAMAAAQQVAQAVDGRRHAKLTAAQMRGSACS